MPSLLICFITVLAMMMSTPSALGEDGSGLWLRYRSPSPVTQIRLARPSPTMSVIGQELERGLRKPIVAAVTEDDALVVSDGKELGWSDELKAVGDEGFILRRAQIGGKNVFVIAARGELGALYGAFHFLRLVHTGADLSALDVRQRPAYKHRLLNHWDNLDGSIERGYAGRSLWKWDELPGKLDQRYTDYARACASIGINGVALNNVNSDPRVLTAEYLVKVKALADLWRPYGIRVYLSANFAAPKMIGGLATADPGNPTVRQWWRDKTDEIYRLIPDFGGFVVKANSEWQPGPQEYGRTHADGANLLRRAGAPSRHRDVARIRL